MLLFTLKKRTEIFTSEMNPRETKDAQLTRKLNRVLSYLKKTCSYSQMRANEKRQKIHASRITFVRGISLVIRSSAKLS